MATKLAEGHTTGTNPHISPEVHKGRAGCSEFYRGENICFKRPPEQSQAHLNNLIRQPNTFSEKNAWRKTSQHHNVHFSRLSFYKNKYKGKNTRKSAVLTAGLLFALRLIFKVFLLVLWGFHALYFDQIYSLQTLLRLTPCPYSPNFRSSFFCLFLCLLFKYSLNPICPAHVFLNMQTLEGVQSSKGQNLKESYLSFS